MVTIHARRAARLPAAFHPILRLPAYAGALHLAAKFANARTYPAALGGTLAPDASFTQLDAVPGAHGPVDLSRLPLGPAGEECVQLLDISAPITAAYPDESFALTLDWDRAARPHALLWLHDRGLDTPPWNAASVVSASSHAPPRSDCRKRCKAATIRSPARVIEPR